MPRDGPGTGGLRRSRRLRAAAATPDPDWRDWARGLPDEVLAKVAGTVVSSNEADWAGGVKERFPNFTEVRIQEMIAQRKRDGKCLFVFARVCKGWRKAQLKVGGPLRTRLVSDMLLPGNVALLKWALAEGCPREDDRNGSTMAHTAALYGHMVLVRWLIQEQGFAMDRKVMVAAAGSGNLELVRWLRANSCPWDWRTCLGAVHKGHVEVLRWLRENGCPWTVFTRNRAKDLGYADDFGNLHLL